jgi:Hypothetical protein (DUF2513)
MKRDMDLIRRMVLAARNFESKPDYRGLDELEGVSSPVFYEHAKLLQEAKLAEVILSNYIPQSPYDEPGAIILRLTWNGQDFAQLIEEDTAWSKAKETIIKPGISWGFGILLEYLKSQAKIKLGLNF